MDGFNVFETAQTKSRKVSHNKLMGIVLRKTIVSIIPVFYLPSVSNSNTIAANKKFEQNSV